VRVCVYARVNARESMFTCACMTKKGRESTNVREHSDTRMYARQILTYIDTDKDIHADTVKDTDVRAHTCAGARARTHTHIFTHTHMNNLPRCT